MSKEAQQAVSDFLRERPTMRDHDTVPHIALNLKEEVDEMLAEYTWGEEEPTPEQLQKLSAELADVFIYAYGICDLLGIDANQAVLDKVAHNHERFPKELFQTGDFQTAYMARKIELGERSPDVPDQTQRNTGEF